ncbi:ethanolamine utilization protein EutJ [Thermosediminibacter litoriperuensis]|uniref:Ethanolamine utilization protein EutJ n=1 Tax=Thermosediminibacter litoriperuensis TaxID=291989 RepID=A0A5S5ASQ4_9FIRM|nr:ethanolamine utilization protein EutJ [Thermosediminibacter litoriperuensis]TYP55474.1 ethanolamine utilization protein EutJ [Thermosediminibacter litoriperuensis]
MNLTGEKLCEKFASCVNSRPLKRAARYRVGVDLGTANVVVAVVDEDGEPVAGKLKKAQVVRDGLVVDFVGARDILTKMIQELCDELGEELVDAACAVPPGTGMADSKATMYVVEASGLEVRNIVDEPSAAAKVLGITNGAVVDIGGGTTGISVLREGKVVYTADEPTGGTHFTLVLAGHFNLPFDEAENIKLDEKNQKRLFPILKPTMEKVTDITKRHIQGFDVGTIYLVGGASALYGLKDVMSNVLGIEVVVPQYPLYVTPLGIALSCP